jgi:hypothetical protein
MKNLKFMFLGLLAFPVLGVVLVQLYVWITMYGIVHSINSEIAEVEKAGKADSSFRPGLEITGIEDSGYQKLGYVALTSIGKIHDYRFVTVESYVRLKDMLEAGEEMPDKEMLSAFVTARVVRFAAAECEFLKKSLAAECTVSSTHASPSANGLVDISISLNFIQKSEFGTIRAKKKAAYVEMEQSLIDGSTAKIVSLGGAAGLRGSLYERAVNLCGKIRSSEGNWAISNVVIRANPNAATGPINVLSPTRPLRPLNRFKHASQRPRCLVPAFDGLGLV